MIEKAQEYGAHSVFFEGNRSGKHCSAQAFVFIAKNSEEDHLFAEVHKKLWSWGGVPLLYRKLPGKLQLFRCAHGPDFLSPTGELICNPAKTLLTAIDVTNDPWWDAEQIHNGALWDDADTCKALLSSQKSAHKALIDAVRAISRHLNSEGILPKHLRRRLLIVSLLIAYLEQRGAFKDGYLNQFLKGTTRFFEILSNGPALVSLLQALETRFNGHVFSFDAEDLDRLRTSQQLGKFSKLIEGREEAGGQLTLWEIYSFKDLPVELISHIYQLFVKDADSSVYTPPFLVRLMLGEALSWERIADLVENNKIILDPACGSGVFLVEAYKKLVLHWRSCNQWKKPPVTVLKKLLKLVQGIDLEDGAVELAAFSLCLALCDALEPEALRSSIKLFPLLAGKTLHHSCFFAAKENGLITEKIGVLLGNPPFTSQLTTPGAQRSYDRYTQAHGKLPDRQLAYLFLCESMEMVSEGGVLCLLQQYNFLYNLQSIEFRRQFFTRWDVREIFDFVSIRGLFHKGDADTKIIFILAEAAEPPVDRQILHATFRRTGRSAAQQGFDVDYYDLHWIPRELALKNDSIWRSNLFGGGRALNLVDRLGSLRTLRQYAQEKQWDHGEGFIAAKTGKRTKAQHLTGKKYLPSNALLADGPDLNAITIVEENLFRSAYTRERFTPPMLLIRAHMDLAHCVWTESYLAYSQRVIGFCAPKKDTKKIKALGSWLSKVKTPLQAYLALISPSLFIQKATALQADDIFSIPYPKNRDLELSLNEEIVVQDIVQYYRDFIRLGEDSPLMREDPLPHLAQFNSTFVNQLNSVYRKPSLRTLEPHVWPGVICQPYAFGKGRVDWKDGDSLRQKIHTLLEEKQNDSLHLNRVARVYDDCFIFLIKPNRLRFWLRSSALRDADETLADLRLQGF